jgi:hypothetical protein
MLARVGKTKPRSFARKWLPVIALGLATAGGSLWLMRWWAVEHVDAWARRASIREDRPDGTSRTVPNYTVPGTYGDAFGPMVGVLTALALGAAVASAFMQREEMEEARTQFTAQAKALDKANDLAEAANELELLNMTLNIMQQLADAEAFGVEVTRHYDQSHPSKAWATMVDKEDKGVAPEGWRLNPDVRSVLVRRRRLLNLMVGLDARMGEVQSSLRKRLVQKG